MMPDDAERRIAALEAKVQELDALVNLALKLLSVEKPVSALLERYGATRAEDLAIHALLDDVATRAERGGMYAPSFRGFQNRKVWFGRIVQFFSSLRTPVSDGGFSRKIQGD